jgi:hypothetical protein
LHVNLYERFRGWFAPKPTPIPPPVIVDTIPPASRLPRGLRNKNPGNIRGSAELWRGEIGRDADDFCVFATDELGLRALAKLLLTYQSKHNLRTVEKMIGRWAPPGDNNNTPAYVAAVCLQCGVGPRDVVFLAGDRMLLCNFVRAIVKHENGRQPYPPGVIESAVAMALST